MNFVDFYLLSIYNSYNRIHKIAPWAVFNGPAGQASTMAALYPALLFFSGTVFLKFWNTETKMMQQFIIVTSLLITGVFLSFYFEKRILKIRSQKIDELKSNKVLRILAVNLFIGTTIALFTLSMRQIL
jgi:hypothetical protein